MPSSATVREEKKKKEGKKIIEVNVCDWPFQGILTIICEYRWAPSESHDQDEIIAHNLY